MEFGCGFALSVLYFTLNDFGDRIIGRGLCDLQVRKVRANCDSSRTELWGRAFSVRGKVRVSDGSNTARAIRFGSGRYACTAKNPLVDSGDI